MGYIVQLVYQVEFYSEVDGEIPLRTWLNSIDRASRTRIETRFLRIAEGNLVTGKRWETV